MKITLFVELGDLKNWKNDLVRLIDEETVIARTKRLNHTDLQITVSSENIKFGGIREDGSCKIKTESAEITLYVDSETGYNDIINERKTAASTYRLNPSWVCITVKDFDIVNCEISNTGLCTVKSYKPSPKMEEIKHYRVTNVEKGNYYKNKRGKVLQEGEKDILLEFTDFPKNHTVMFQKNQATPDVINVGDLVYGIYRGGYPYLATVLELRGEKILVQVNKCPARPNKVNVHYNEEADSVYPLDNMNFHALSNHDIHIVACALGYKNISDLTWKNEGISDNWQHHKPSKRQLEIYNQNLENARKLLKQMIHSEYDTKPAAKA